MYNFSLPPLPPKQELNIGNALLGPMMMVEQMKTGNIKNKLLQEELAKREGIKNALKGYGEAGFNDTEAMKKLMPIAPEMAIQIKDMMRKATKEQIEIMASGATLVEKFGPSLKGNFQAYPQMAAMLGKMGVPIRAFESFIGPDGQIKQQEYDQYVDNLIAGKEIIKAGLEGDKKQLTHIQQGDNMVYGNYSPKTGTFEAIPGASGPKQGLSQEIVLPDGTVIKQGSGPGGASSTGMQKTTAGNVEKDLLEYSGSLLKLGQIQRDFRPEYQTFAGQIWNKYLGVKGKLDPNSLSQDEKNSLQGFTAHRAQATEFMSKTLNERFGSALTEHEKKIAMAFLPNTGSGWLDGDSPDEFSAKVKNFNRMAEQATARLNWIRKNGISFQNGTFTKEGKPIDGPSLERMDSIMKQQAEKIGAELKAKGLKGDQLVTETWRQTAQYFGIPF